MATIQEHLTAIYERLDDFDRRLSILLAESNPLAMEIDLDLPHASAGNAEPEGAAAGGEATVESEVTDDTITVSLPAASSERKAQRRQFADEVMQLNETFPGLEDEGGLTAVDAYERGGPMWLYLGSKEGRDHILTLPPGWKQAMVEDVQETSNPQTAHEFARDVLKDVEPAAGMGVTYDYLLSTAE